MGHAVANRRLPRHIRPDLERPAEMLDVEATFPALRDTLRAAVPDARSTSEPSIVLVSSGPTDSAWFDHELLGEAMDIPVVPTSDLVVHDGTVYLRRHGVRRRVDVIYLRMDDDDLVHATGADGRPLGPSLLSGWRRERSLWRRPRQQDRRRQGGLRLRPTDDRLLPRRAATARSRADVPVRRSRPTRPRPRPARRNWSSNPSTATAARVC